MVIKARTRKDTVYDTQVLIKKILYEKYYKIKE